jgi:hypothetical protein
MEALQNKSDVTIQLFVGSLVIHFVGIFHPELTMGQWVMG